MFTVKIVIVLPKASGSCSHECSLSLSLSLPLSLFPFLSPPLSRETKMSHTHGRLILLFAGSCPAFYFVGIFLSRRFSLHILVLLQYGRFCQYFTANNIDYGPLEVATNTSKHLIDQSKHKQSWSHRQS